VTIPDEPIAATSIGLVIGTIGMVRARAKISLANLVSTSPDLAGSAAPQPNCACMIHGFAKQLPSTGGADDASVIPRLADHSRRSRRP
jgi:hypothetical protein